MLTKEPSVFVRNWILRVEHESGGTRVEGCSVLRDDGGLADVGGRADRGRAIEKVR